MYALAIDFLQRSLRTQLLICSLAHVLSPSSACFAHFCSIPIFLFLFLFLSLLTLSLFLSRCLFLSLSLFRFLFLVLSAGLPLQGQNIAATFSSNTLQVATTLQSPTSAAATHGYAPPPQNNLTPQQQPSQRPSDLRVAGEMGTEAQHQGMFMGTDAQGALAHEDEPRQHLQRQVTNLNSQLATRFTIRKSL